MGKFLKADFNRQYSSTKAEPSLFLFYDIKENNKDFNESTSREYKEWMTKLIDSGILEPVNETLPGNKMLSLRHTWIIEGTVYVGETVPCYKICIAFKIKARPREAKPKDVKIAKNYLSELELKRLNLLVSEFLDFAEFQALEEKPMKMQDWITALDNQIVAHQRKILEGKGSISHEQAMQKAEKEYDLFRQKELANLKSDFDLFLQDVRKIETR